VSEEEKVNGYNGWEKRMKTKQICRLLVMSFFIIAFLICSGCSRKVEKEKAGSKTMHAVYERVLKEKREIARRGQKNNAYTDEQLAVSNDCSMKYDSCVEKCENNSCENKCLERLSRCEKDLPEALKTLKGK
jgi:hypothetical protein